MDRASQDSVKAAAGGFNAGADVPVPHRAAAAARLRVGIAALLFENIKLCIAAQQG